MDELPTQASLFDDAPGDAEPGPASEEQRPPAADQGARDAIRTRLADTLFVEAGAGTGKTTALVGRIVELVRAGHPMRGIAAITFTEAAAAELRDRVRIELEKAAHAGLLGTGADDPAAKQAVAEVDEAAISTLHAFAQRILAEHPLEAGLPPAFEVLDEIQSGLAFEERWGRFVDTLLEDEAMQPVVLRGMATGMKLAEVQEVALAFHDHWDRLDEIELDAPPLAPIDVGPVVSALRAAHAHRDHCKAEADLLFRHLEDFADRADRLERAGELEILNVLTGGKAWSNNRGTKASWPDVEAARSLCGAPEELRQVLLTRTRTDVLSNLLVALRRFTLDSAEERRVQGRLEFHDLLVLARRLLRARTDVRAALRDRFSHLLIDEFQDTDPIQVELAVLLAATDAGDDTIEDGRLFFVGDAKQSIYRFRRADIGLFLDVKNKVGDALSLTQNFRSVPGVLTWVNHVFTNLMGEGIEGAQPAYEALQPAPQRVPLTHELPVVLVGRTHPKGRGGPGIASVRQEEAEELAGAIAAMAADEWPVSDLETGEARPAQLRDVAILLPTRTSLPQLEAALEDQGIAYRVQSSSLVWGTQEVRDLLAVLAAVDDPTNEVALVAALRSPAFACGDDDLLAYRQAGGRWNLRAPCPETLTATHPVCAAIGTLRALDDRRWWLGVSGMVEEVARSLRFFELAFAHHRPRDYWRRLRFVIDQARAFEEGGSHVTLRDFVSWAERQGADDARVKESVLPEADDDAVRIFTIHGAKGLEFPICVLTGLNRAKAGYRAVVVFWDDEGRPQVKMAKFETPGFEAVKEREVAMNALEQDRLLYVGTTRARDHLVVSVHHKEGDKSAADQLVKECDKAPELWRRYEAALALTSPPARSAPVASGDEAAARREWDRSRSELIEAGRRAPVVSATELAKGAGDVVVGDEAAAEEHESEADVAPWRRGRAGTAIGRAVHATLQSVDLATGEGVGHIAAAQAAAEGIDDRAAEVERLARVALESDVVKEAVKGRYWRELYIAAPLEGQLVEGFIDLLYEGPDGLVIVDWKTDQVRNDAEVAALADRYGDQLRAYARVLGTAMGSDVVRAVLVVPMRAAVVPVGLG